MTYIVFAQAAEGGGGAFGGSGGLIFMLLFFAIFYMFFIRPQMSKQKKEKNFRANLKKGDRVITLGGIHGRISSLDDRSVLLEVDDKMKLRVQRSHIGQYVVDEQQKEKAS